MVNLCAWLSLGAVGLAAHQEPELGVDALDGTSLLQHGDLEYSSTVEGAWQRRHRWHRRVGLGSSAPSSPASRPHPSRTQEEEALLGHDPGTTTTQYYAGAVTLTSVTTATTVFTVTSTTTATLTEAHNYLQNGGFEAGSTTIDYEYACSIPGWVTTASNINGEDLCPVFIRNGLPQDAPFGGTDASEGDYFLGLRRTGAAVSQAVQGHIVGNQYRFEFYAAKRGLMNEDPVVRIRFDNLPFGDFPITTRTMQMHTIDYVANSSIVTIQLQNLSPNQYSTVFIDAVQVIDKPVLPARCSDLLRDGQVWGQDAKGIDLSRYTGGTLKWIGCNGNGCEAASFYCLDTAGIGMEFGTNSTKALRALLGSYYPTSGNNCATATSKHDLMNSMDTLPALTELCLQLGYPAAEVVHVGPQNNCPELSWNSTGQYWTSDFERSEGYGKEFRCLELSTTTSGSSTTNTTTTETTTTPNATTISTTMTTTGGAAPRAAGRVSHPMVQNGGFETGLSTASVLVNPPAMQGWSLSKKIYFIKAGRPAEINFGGVLGAEGSYFIACQSRGASVSQSVPNHVPGGSYELQFLVAKRTGNLKVHFGDPTVSVVVAGVELSRFVPASQHFEMRSVRYIAEGATVDIRLENVSPSGDRTFYLDSVTVVEEASGGKAKPKQSKEQRKALPDVPEAAQQSKEQRKVLPDVPEAAPNEGAHPVQETVAPQEAGGWSFKSGPTPGNGTWQTAPPTNATKGNGSDHVPQHGEGEPAPSATHQGAHSQGWVGPEQATNEEASNGEARAPEPAPGEPVPNVTHQRARSQGETGPVPVEEATASAAKVVVEPQALERRIPAPIRWEDSVTDTRAEASNFSRPAWQDEVPIGMAAEGRADHGWQDTVTGS